MRLTKDQVADHRARILEAAARLFRERGPDVPVANVTRAAGLTHGGFYNHFASKEALLGEAVETTLTHQAGQIAAVCAESGLEDYAKGYLSEAHLTNRATGCVVAALGSDLARAGPEVRGAYARGLRHLADAAASTPGMERSEALEKLAAMIGAMVMARAVEGVDDALGKELLSAVAKTRP